MVFSVLRHSSFVFCFPIGGGQCPLIRIHRQQNQRRQPSVHFSFLRIPDQVRRRSRQQRGNYANSARQPKLTRHLISQGHHQHPANGREIAQRKLAIAGEGAPKTQSGKIKRAVMPFLRQNAQQIPQRSTGIPDGVHFIAPQALRVQMINAQSKGKQHNCQHQ